VRPERFTAANGLGQEARSHRISILPTCHLGKPHALLFSQLPLQLRNWQTCQFSCKTPTLLRVNAMNSRLTSHHVLIGIKHEGQQPQHMEPDARSILL
jgi:hypothetical protein